MKTYINENSIVVKLLDDFIIECKNNFEDKNKIDLCDYIGKEKFLKEYCTLRLNYPRQTGITTLALKLFDKYDSNFCTIMNRYCDNIKYRINIGTRNIDGKLIYEFENKKKIKDIININSQKFDNDFKEIIIIDMFSYIKINSLEKFYKEIGKNNNVKCIIGLG